MLRRKTSIAVAVILLLILFVAIRASFHKDVEDMTVKELIEAQRDNPSRLKHHTVLVAVLRKIGINTVPRFIDSISGVEYQKSVLAAIQNLGPEAIPTLIEALQDKDEDEWVRAAAAVGLGLIGPEAEDAIPALIEALLDVDEKAWVAADDSVIHVRSASRVGHSDLGANGKRAERLREHFEGTALRRQPGGKSAAANQVVLTPRNWTAPKKWITVGPLKQIVRIKSLTRIEIH